MIGVGGGGGEVFYDGSVVLVCCVDEGDRYLSISLCFCYFYSCLSCPEYQVLTTLLVHSSFSVYYRHFIMITSVL